MAGLLTTCPKIADNDPSHSYCSTISALEDIRNILTEHIPGNKLSRGLQEESSLIDDKKISSISSLMD
jgi:hypothetical protein